MKKIDVLNIKGEKASDITLNEKVWGIEPNDAVLYDAITLARNSQRQGTHDTKTRTEVSGGGRKPYRQKGTGHARQGSTRAPQWRGGGIVFGLFISTQIVNCLSIQHLQTKKSAAPEKRVPLICVISRSAR